MVSPIDNDEVLWLSDGTFSLAGEIKDAKAAITHLIDSDMTVESWSGVYGASDGGAVAACALANDPRVHRQGF